jgi:hypothetical protein
MVGEVLLKEETRDDPLYRELVEQVNSRQCVAFVGSGLSMGYYPSWSDLIGELCEACGLLNEAVDARGTQDHEVRKTTRY